MSKIKNKKKKKKEEEEDPNRKEKGWAGWKDE
jgi:hypothetical protein